MTRSRVTIVFQQHLKELRVINEVNSDSYVDIQFIISGEDFVSLTATGGDRVYDIEDVVAGHSWRVHEFTTSGLQNFEVTDLGSAPRLEYLIVAGGGHGGANRGGGGGGGGVLFGDTLLSTGTYPIVVGNGRVSSNGEDSSFNSLIAIGGGKGGYTFVAGNAGGSGGGAGINSLGGIATPGQGNDGGNSVGAGEGEGGGGGGATGVGGGSAGRGRAGAGGSGLSSSITGTIVVYGSGGGGGNFNSGNYTPGTPGGDGAGDGAGGRGGPIATDALPNRGGGGGGGSDPNFKVGAGGSGIVVISYPLKKVGPPDSEFRFTDFSFGWDVYNNGVLVESFEFPIPSENEAVNTAKLISTNQSLIFTDRFINIQRNALMISAWARNDGILYTSELPNIHSVDIAGIVARAVNTIGDIIVDGDVKDTIGNVNINGNVKDTIGNVNVDVTNQTPN